MMPLIEMKVTDVLLSKVLIKNNPLFNTTKTWTLN
jgi:hypothetical protein